MCMHVQLARTALVAHGTGRSRDLRNLDAAANRIRVLPPTIVLVNQLDDLVGKRAVE